MQTTRRTMSKAYAFGIRVNSTMLMFGFTPTDLLLGVRWDRGHFTLHFGLFIVGLLWGIEDE